MAGKALFFQDRSDVFGEIHLRSADEAAEEECYERKLDRFHDDLVVFNNEGKNQAGKGGLFVKGVFLCKRSLFFLIGNPNAL